jgi:hypothetical protein
MLLIAPHRFALGIAAMIAACGPVAGVDVDAGGAADGGLAIGPRAVVEAPRDLRCNAASDCAVASCAPAERPALEGGCVALDACPDTDFREPVATGEVRYVRAGATGGDGTSDRPFATIAEALAGASGGTTITIARGVYDEAIELSDDIHLVGACAAETTIRSSIASVSRAVISVLGTSDASIAHLSIGASARPGIAVADGTLALDAVAVRETEIATILALAGGAVSGHDVLLAGARPRDGAAGHGLYAEEGGTVVLAGVALVGHRSAAVLATDEGSRVRLEGAVISGTRAASSGGQGVTAQLGATVELAAAILDDNEDAGLFAIAGGVLDLDDVTVRATGTRADGKGGHGLFVQDGAIARGRRVSLIASHEVALVARGAAVDLEDVAIVDTEPGTDPTSPGFGVLGDRGADVSLTRARLERCRGVAIGASGSRLAMEDVAVIETLPDSLDGTLGHAIEATVGATVDCTRCLVDRAHGAAVIADGAGTAIMLADTTVQSILPQVRDGSFGHAVMVQAGARATITDALIIEAHDVGLFADGDGSELLVERTLVRRILASPTHAEGRGVAVQRDAHGILRDVRVEDCVGFGVVAVGAVLELMRVVIADVRPPSCATSTCGDQALAAGLASHSGASVSVSGFEIARSGVCGVQVIDHASLDLADGTIRDVAIGACVQVDGYDLERLTRTVLYVGTDVPVQTTDREPAIPHPTIDPSAP